MTTFTYNQQEQTSQPEKYYLLPVLGNRDINLIPTSYVLILSRECERQISQCQVEIPALNIPRMRFVTLFQEIWFIITVIWTKE